MIEYKGICRDGRTYGPAHPWMHFPSLAAASVFAAEEALRAIEEWRDREVVIAAEILVRDE